MDAAGVIAHYVLDTSTGLSASGNQPLTAESSGNTTFFLYGRGAIGEKTATWNYSLADGTNTPRQLSDPSGDITLSARYTPCPLRCTSGMLREGDTLELNGTGNPSTGSRQARPPAQGRFHLWLPFDTASPLRAGIGGILDAAKGFPLQPSKCGS